MSKYGDKIESLANMERSELFEATKCVMPCTFMEYKVSMKFFKIHRSRMCIKCNKLVLLWGEAQLCLPAHPTGHGNCLLFPFPQAFNGGMCRFELRIEEADF